MSATRALKGKANAECEDKGEDNGECGDKCKGECRRGG